MCGKVRFALPRTELGVKIVVQGNVMDNKSYARPLLAVGVVGLAVTCFVATSAIRTGASPEAPPAPLATAAVVSQQVVPAPIILPPVPQGAPAPAAPAVHRASIDAGREAACQAEFDKVVEENPIVFPKDRWDLDTAAKAAVDKLFVIGKACSGLRIEVQAYTDNQGKRLNNTRLSSNRADAVKKYLVELGLSPSLLTAVGFGADHPVASNRTAKGRARNRRIAFRVTRVESE